MVQLEPQRPTARYLGSVDSSGTSPPAMTAAISRIRSRSPRRNVMGEGAPGEVRTLTCGGGLWVVEVAELSTVKGKIQHCEISRQDLLGIALYATGV